MKKLLLVMVIGIGIVFLWSGAPYAQMCGCMQAMGQDDGRPMMGGMGRGMMGGGMMGSRMGDGDRGPHMMDDDNLFWKNFKALGLDQKQEEAIREIKHRVMKETIRKKAEKKIAGIELKDLLDKDPVDMKAVEAKLKQKEALRTEIHLAHIKAKEEIKTKLTPDQRKMLEGMIEMGPMMGGMGMMRGKGMKCPCPARECPCPTHGKGMMQCPCPAGECPCHMMQQGTGAEKSDSGEMEEEQPAGHVH